MKRMIRASREDERHLSGVSFDFIYPDKGFQFNKMDHDIDEAFSRIGIELLGFDVYEVDYSMYPEYADKNIAQGGADFGWSGDYSESQIKEAIEDALYKQYCNLIGQLDLYSLDWTRR